MGLPAAMLGVGAIGAGVSALGSYESGQATAAAAAYQAQVAANNAKVAQENASFESAAGETASVNKGLQTRATVGKEKAYTAASGVDVNTGSAPAVRAGTEEMGLLDQLTIRSNAAKSAWAQQVQATSDTAQSQLYKFEGEQAKTAGDIGAAGSLLSGASTVGGNYAKWSNQFGTSGS